MKFQCIVPILYSADIERSIRYYVDVLGFTGKWEWETPPTFGGVSKDEIEIYFCKEGQGQPGTWLSIYVENVDAFFETIKAKGANIISEPESYPWGVREMLVQDPDGHFIRFGHGIEPHEG